MSQQIAEILASVGIRASSEKVQELANLLEVKKQKKVIAKKWAVVEGAEFGAKTPLQMRQCVESIRDLESVGTEEWVSRLGAYEGFRTQQPVERIIAFYKKRMLDEGLIRAVE